MLLALTIFCYKVIYCSIRTEIVPSKVEKLLIAESFYDKNAIKRVSVALFCWVEYNLRNKLWRNVTFGIQLFSLNFLMDNEKMKAFF